MICSAREGSGPTGPFRAVFSVRCHSQLDLLSAFTVSKKVNSALSVSVRRGASEEPVPTSVPGSDGAAWLPGEERISSWGFGKQLSVDRACRPQGCFCKVSFGPSADEGVSPEPVVVEARAPQETQRGFYYFWVQVWTRDD